MSQIDEVLAKYRVLYAKHMVPSHDDVLAAIKALEIGGKADDTLAWIYRNWPDLETAVKDFRQAT